AGEIVAGHPGPDGVRQGKSERKLQESIHKLRSVVARLFAVEVRVSILCAVVSYCSTPSIKRMNVQAARCASAIGRKHFKISLTQDFNELADLGTATDRLQIARDEGLDHLAGAVGLRPGLRDPFVLAVREHVEFDLAARSLVSRGAFLL